jgi:monofunctional biosynthetic peptidoglycan transglycosylase
MLTFLWRWLWRLAALALLAILGFQLWLLAHVWYWVDHNPATTAFMDARREALQAANPRAQIKQQWVVYERVSVHLKRALVAAEDAKFADHEGFDWDGIQHALERNLKKGRIVAGGSTISQQLAKNLFLSGVRTPWRKAQEALITLMLEKLMSKRRILEIYVNVIEWGVGVFGAEAAARHYYGVSAAALSPGQAATLAAMVPAPRYYDAHRSAPGLAKRAGIIAARMPAAQLP